MNENFAGAIAWFLIISGVLLTMFGIVLLVFTFLDYRCDSRWEQSGMATDWGPIKGCQIEVSKGKWIPEERYRQVEN